MCSSTSHRDTGHFPCLIRAVLLGQARSVRDAPDPSAALGQSVFEAQLQFLLATFKLKSQLHPVNALQFDIPLDDPPGYQANAVLGDSFFAALIEPREVRRLRAAVTDLAHIVSGHPQRRGILILDAPRITEARLLDEWSAMKSILRPEILRRLAMVISLEGTRNPMVGRLSSLEEENVQTVIDHARRPNHQKPNRPAEAFFDVLRVLMVHWIRKSGAITSKELSEQTGFTYPTIAAALEKLEPHLRRHSDRRVELQSFPRNAWLKLVAQSEKVRSTHAYADRSGRPRQLDVLLNRLREQAHEEVAIGGVLGARHYVPGLDLVGAPRLDLVLRSNRIGNDKDLVRRLDPALKPAERGEPAQVVVHTLYRPVSFFVKDRKGDRYADEAECLLDLHDARLEQQAMEFLEKISPSTR